MEQPDEDELHDDHNVLVTRSQQIYKRSLKQAVESTPAKKSKTSKRHNYFFCKEHSNAKKWTEGNTTCQFCIKYDLSEGFKNGMLQNGKEVLQYLLSLKAENQGRHANNEYECAVLLCLQWIYCNVYPISIKCTQYKIQKMLDSYKGLKKFSTKTEVYWNKFEQFAQTQTVLFDIRANTEKTIAQEKLWGVKMTLSDRQFYENQKEKPRIGYCTSYTDRKW